jgi:hypothetical protein
MEKKKIRKIEALDQRPAGTTILKLIHYIEDKLRSKIENIGLLGVENKNEGL